MASDKAANGSNMTLSEPLVPLDTAEGKVQLFVFVFTFLLGSMGNILVLVVVHSKQSRRSVNDLYIMNLAIADLIFIAFLPFFSYNQLFEAMILSTAVCKFVTPMMTITFFVSIYTLTFMAVHRCFVILNPFQTEMTHKKVYMCIGVIWLVCFIFLIPMSVVSLANPLGGCMEDWPSHSHKQAYTASLLLLQYVLPLLVITIAYIRICFDLNRSRGPKYERNARHNQFHSENLQIVKTLATIVVVFAVCLLPGQVVWMLVDFGSEDKQSMETFFSISVISTALHSCLNPIVYGTLTKQFRREYMRYLRYLCGCCSSTEGCRKPQLESMWVSISSHDQHHIENNNKSERAKLKNGTLTTFDVPESRV